MDKTRFFKTRYTNFGVFQIHINKNGKRYIEWDLKKFIYNNDNKRDKK